MELSVKDEDGTYYLYNESFWTSKKSLTVDGVAATKLAKRTFRVERSAKPSEDHVNDGQNTELSFTADEALTQKSQPEYEDFNVKGNFLTGVSLVSNSGKTVVLAKNKWYDWLMIFFPVIGIPFGVMFCGVIGGFFSALFTMLAATVNANISRSKKPLAVKIPLQIVVAVVANALWVAVWYVIAVLILSAL